ncbi:MAG: DHH family phosphoesterase, partial [Clostridia bacterium]|nr:DHH family phosphoesterase [Clostridia bacterium]
MKSLKSRRTLFFSLLFIVAFCYCGVLYFLSYKALSIIFFAIVVVMACVYFYLYRQMINHSVSLITGLVDFLKVEDKESLDQLNVPAVLLNSENVPVWFNNKFLSEVAAGSSDLEKEIGKYFPKDLSITDGNSNAVVECDDKIFSVYSSQINGKKSVGQLIMYFDITDLKKDSDELKKIRPSVLIGFYDNLDEMFQDYSESEFDEIKVGVDKLVDSYLKEYGCISRKIGSDRFFAIVHEKDLERMANDKFNIVDKIKENKFGSAFGGVSLSIGVGKGQNLVECEKNARQSLDMALSRGGDQVAVKNEDSYEFFGGLSTGNYKTDKVRSRVVANGILQLFNFCDEVFIVGHKFSDMDSIGAAVGLISAARHLGKNAYIVCNRETSLSNKLIDRVISVGGNNIFIDGKKAESLMNSNSVLFVVDTHRKERLEYPELLNKTENIVIIDHHRKAVDFISNAVIFHHDPNASSTCEMVAEILPYLLEDK